MQPIVQTKNVMYGPKNRRGRKTVVLDTKNDDEFVAGSEDNTMANNTEVTLAILSDQLDRDKMEATFDMTLAFYLNQQGYIGSGRIFHN
jgi:hypothetical protein